MLIVIIAALLGIWRYRTPKYFKWVAITFGWILITDILFNGGGTLENPAGDGLITREIRIATADGPGMGIFAFVLLLVHYGGVLFFVSRMVRAARIAKEAGKVAAFQDLRTDQSNSGRKAIETIALLLVASAFIWLVFSAQMTSPSSPVVSPTMNSPAPSAATQPTIESVIAEAAKQINANVPQRLDHLTTLLHASTSGRTLTYHYKVDATSEQRDELQRVVLEDVVSKTCAGNLGSDIRHRGLSVAYSYSADAFAEPVLVTVNDRVCAY